MEASFSVYLEDGVGPLGERSRPAARETPGEQAARHQTDGKRQERGEDAEALEDATREAHLEREREGAADPVEPAEVGAHRLLVDGELALRGRP